jgi:replicative DNA helicase
MTPNQAAVRMLCGRAKVDSHRMRRGFLMSQEYVGLTTTVGYLAKAPLLIASLSQANLDDLCELAMKTVRENGCRMIAIDYVQRVDGPGENRTEQLTNISSRLKALAMQLRIPVLCASQLNRAPVARTSPQFGIYRPRLEDLRGSGSLEDDADVVILLHREDVQRQDDPDFQPDNIAEFIVAKQRNGPTGTSKAIFDPKSLRFENLVSATFP